MALGALALLALLGAGCGHREKVRLQPPQPPLPPGVTWGTAAGTTAAGSGAAPPPQPSLGRLTPQLPAPWRQGESWEGIASYYGPQEQGHATASGERFDYHKLTAAHRTLPFGTRVRVTDLTTGRSVVVRINDRGPFWPHRNIDLSLAAARRIGLYKTGLGRVNIQVVSLPDPLPPGRYTVQAGWFHRSGKLKSCRREMQKAAGQRVVEFHSRSGSWLRYGHEVSLDQATAERIARALQAKGYSAYLVRLN